MSHNYRDVEQSYDRITHSTPKKSRDDYGSAISSSYVPGQSIENHVSESHQGGNVNVKSGVTRTVTQSVKKTSSSSTRSSGYSSEDGRKEDDNGHADILNSRIGGALESSTTVQSYGTTSSNDGNHVYVDRRKPSNVGFEYEDIDSFRERQKIEGDNLQMHRQGLTANIVGTAKRGDSTTTSTVSKPGDSIDTTYSNRITSSSYKSSSGGNDPLSRENLLAESRARNKDLSGGAHSTTTTTSSYSVSGSRDDAKDKLLADGKDRGSGQYSGSSHEYRYSNRLSGSKEDLTGSSKDPSTSYGGSRESALQSSRYTSGLSRSIEDILGPSSTRESAVSPSRYSSGLSRSREDITASKDSDALSGRSGYSSGLSRSIEDILGHSTSREPTSSYGNSRESALQSSRYSSDLSRSKEDLTGSSRDKDPLSSKDSALYSSRYSSGLSRSVEDILGSSKDRYSSSNYGSRYSSDLSRSGRENVTSPTSRAILDDRVNKSHLGAPQDDSYTKSDALVSKYLQSSRHKNLSKHASESDLQSRHSPLGGIKEEDREDDSTKGARGRSTDVKHHSVSGRPMSYLPSSSSYEDLLQRKRESVASDEPTTDKYNRYSYGDSYSSRISREQDKRFSDKTKRLSTELHENRKARQNAIDRLLESTRRYSSDSILDKNPREKQTDALLGSSYSKDLDTAGNRYDSRYNERKPGEGPGNDRDKYSRDDKDISITHGVTREVKTHRYSESPYETPYTSLDHSHKPDGYKPGIDDGRIYDSPQRMHPDGPDRGERRPSDDDNSKGIYDKLNRGIDPADKPKEPGNPNDNTRGSRDLEPVYDRLNMSSGVVGPRGHGSPVPISDKYSLPLDKYEKPIARHTGDPSRPDDPRGKEIVSRHHDPRDYALDAYTAGNKGGVTETTKTSITQRSFMSRDGKVLKDETKHHEEVLHGGQNALEGPGSNSDLPTRIQRYPPVTANDIPGHRRPSDSDYTRPTPEDRKREGNDQLDDILKRSGININDTNNSTNYQEQTRKNQVTRISDDSNIRTKINRTDVNTNVNIVKEIVREKKAEKPGKSGIAGLRSKIEALTKSVDDLMSYKHKTVLQSYVQEHSDRRPSQDLEALPKPEYYEVKSKRYEPNIKLDEVDYVHKEVEIEKSQKRPEFHGEITVENMWITKERQSPDIDHHIPSQTNLIPEKKGNEWWNAGTAEAADRFLCIGDWQWWNADTCEGADHLLGIRAINRETGAAGAIIVKNQGDENNIEWAWYKASEQPSHEQKRRTLTRAMKKDMKIDSEWWDAPTAEDADKHLSIGNYKWWEDNTTEGVDQVLGVKGSTEETGTILATYTGGTKPTAWTYVEASEEPMDTPDPEKHSVRRSSRNLYIDETVTGNVELLIRVKDEETTTQQQQRYLQIRPGPVEKAIIIREIVEEDIPLDTINEVSTIQGETGDGLQVQDGVVKVRIKDMTPEERKAWVHIMGIEKNHKLGENDTLEIPVKVVDHPKTNEAIYAVPNKKKKKKLSKKESDQEEKYPTIHKYKESIIEKKKSETKIKESDAVRKKREQKAKKLEEERERKERESIKKKEKLDEIQRKKAEKESLKKKKESSKKKKETESQKKKKEPEKGKEKESQKKKKDQLIKKSSVSSSKETIVETTEPPPVDRSLKPSERRVYIDAFNRESNNKQTPHQKVRAVQSHASGMIGTKSGAQVDSSSYSGGYSPVRKPGPFAMSNKGHHDRPQSTHGRITTENHTKSIHTVVEETSPQKRQNPSVKVVKRVDITQTGADKTDSVKSKSGNLQRRSTGSHIAVPFRGGAKHGEVSVDVVVQNQHSQSQKAPSQIRQTTVEKTHKTYRTETKVVDPISGSTVFPVQNNQLLPLNRSISDSATNMHMIKGPGGVPLNTVPGVTHRKETHVVEKRVVNQVPSGDQFNTVPLDRQGSSISVTNVSVTSPSSKGQPLVGMVRRTSGDHVVDGDFTGRRGSSHSVKNMSVTSRTTEVQPNTQMSRRLSGDQVDGDHLGRRGSGHAVQNVSVTTRTTELQPGAQLSHRSSSDQIGGEHLGHRGSGHAVQNVSVTTHTTEVQPGAQLSHRSSGDQIGGEHLGRRGSGHAVQNVSVTTRTTEGQHVTRRSSGDLVDTVPLARNNSNQGVMVINPPLNSNNAGGHSVKHHSSSQSTNMVRTTHNDAWNRELSDIPRPNSFGNSGDVHATIVKLHDKPTESSTNVKHIKEETQLPHGYMKRDVYHSRTTNWAVDEPAPNTQL